ncbi:hypothetical protein FRC04_007768 [Tulasnella sp. 424]|nr:hypothetical protein FRC04_007768 [Tulasnella sp. 424]
MSLDNSYYACGMIEKSCSCAPKSSVPFHDCNKCSYAAKTDEVARAKQLKAWNWYLEDCKEAGYPVQGDTVIAVQGAAIVTESSSSAASTSKSATSVTASASATATATATSNSMKSSSNGAIGLSSGSVSSLALPVALIAAYGLLLL